MEGNLFEKYKKTIKDKKNKKEEVLTLIKEITGVSLSEEEVSFDLKTKKISIQTSSVKISFLKRSNLKVKLKEHGYNLPY